jgi:plasmid stabilization system protein ParE
MRSIREGVTTLGNFPAIGRLVEDLGPAFRDWVVPFGAGSYVVRYHVAGGHTVILAVHHIRESGF